MKKLKKGIPFLIYMVIWSLYILFAWSKTHPGQIIEVSLFIAQFKKNVATRSSNLASHQIFYFIRNWKSIHSREKKWHL